VALEFGVFRGGGLNCCGSQLDSIWPTGMVVGQAQTGCMVRRRDIKRLCLRIGQEFRPRQIILFGSYAYGKPSPDSDVDSLVVMRHEGRAIDKAIEIISKLEHRFPIDLIVRSPAELRQRLKWNDFFLREATEKGVVMYESAGAT
jgi:predicted nucleotidyltransferase